MTSKEPRIFLSVLGYLETVAALRLPVLVSFAALFGFQVAINVSPGSGFDWLAPAGAGAILVWLLISWAIARSHWPQAGRLTDALRAFRIGGIGTSSDGNPQGILLSPVGTVLMTLLIMLAIPHWVGLLAAVIMAYLLLLVPVMEEPPYGDVMVSLAAMAVAMPIGSLLGPTGFGLVPHLSAGVMLAAVSALTLVWITTAKQPLHTEREPLFWPERWSMGWALVSAPLILLQQSWVPLTSFLVVCVIVPGLSVFVLLLRIRHFSTRTRRSLTDSSDLRADLTASRATKVAPEAVLRESDGYFRLCAPAYVAIHPSGSQPNEAHNGVVAWIGGDNDDALPESVGECIAMRNLGGGTSRLVVYPDSALQTTRRAFVEALPDFKSNALAEFQEQLRDPWEVRLLPANSPTRLAKLPWEHPELLLLPAQWKGTFVYPPGGGIHDAGGLRDAERIPCYFDEVEVCIDIQPDLLAELRQSQELGRSALSTELSDQSWEILRLLQWNYRRILPAAYECLYGALIAEMRNYRLPLFFEFDEDSPPDSGRDDNLSRDSERRAGETTPHNLTEATLMSLRERVNDRLTAGLPDPIQRLVKVRVLKLSQPDTTILAASQRAAVKDFRSADNTLNRDKLKQLQALEDQLTSELWSRGEIHHFLTLQALRPEILNTADECQDEMIRHVNRPDLELHGSLTGAALDAIDVGTTMLRASTISELDRMTEALNVIRAAFNDQPIDPHGTQAAGGERAKEARRPVT